MSLGPLGFGPLSSPLSQEPALRSPWDLARLFNPQRLDGTGATLTQDGTADLPAGVAEHVSAGGDIAAMFGGAPMGAPQSFSGSATAPVVSSGGFRPHRYDAPADGNGPLPPPRPSAADLGPLSLGPIPGATAQAPVAVPEIDRGGPVAPDFQPAPLPQSEQRVSAADMPMPNAVPISGQMPVVSAAPLAAPAPGTAAPSRAAVPDEGGGFGGAFERFRQNGGFDLVGNLGMGLLSAPTFAGGIAAGMQANQRSDATRAATDLARAEFGLKARKAGQADAGLNLTRSQLAAKGVQPADIDMAMAAAAAGHNDPLNNLLNRFFPKAAEAPTGFTLNPDGSMRRIVGGPQDPNVKREDAKATAEGSASGKPDEPFNLSAGQTRYNADGTPIVSAGTSPSDVFDRETKLRGEFTKQLGTFQDVHDGYGRVIAATEQRQVNPNAKSPAADIGLIFGYMKMLDPGSVVREGEYATAQNAASVPDRVRNAYNKAMNGEFLSPEQRQGFIEQAQALYGKARGGAEGVAERYRGIASQYGVDPGRSVYLPDAYQAPKVGPSRTAIPGSASPLDIGGSRDAGGGITIKRVR